jgi:uncharacterized protein
MSMYPNLQTLDYGRGDTNSMVKLKFFHQVYGWMSVGIMLTTVVSYACAKSGLVIQNPWLAAVAALGAFALSWMTHSIAMRMGAVAGIAMFLAYAALIGVSVSAIWLIYPASTMVAAFGLTAGIFLVTSLLGFIIRADLSKIGWVLGMAVIGLFIASIVNIFMASSWVSWLITYAIVLIFPILIIVQTQELNEFAASAGENPDMANRVAIIGALGLYIAFINIFLAVLRILGSRDE